MNDLSWFIYLADVLEKLGDLFFGLSVIGFILLAIWGFLFLPMTAEGASRDTWKTYWFAGKILIPVTLLLSVAATLIPSSTTMYAIAASEMGERLIHTKTFSKAEQALNAWLDRQIKPTEEKENK